MHQKVIAVLVTLHDVKKTGFPTCHQVRFRSKRWIVEGGIQRPESQQVCEYRGLLIDDNHSDTHICVAVEHEDGWYRSEDWHGMVARTNIIQLVFMNSNGQIMSSDEAGASLSKDFRECWGRIHRSQHTKCLAAYIE